MCPGPVLVRKPGFLLGYAEVRIARLRVWVLLLKCSLERFNLLIGVASMRTLYLFVRENFIFASDQFWTFASDVVTELDQFRKNQNKTTNRLSSHQVYFKFSLFFISKFVITLLE